MLLFAFLIGFAVVLGAQLNNAIQEYYPVRPEHRTHRVQRLLGVHRAREKLGMDMADAPAPEPEKPPAARDEPAASPRVSYSPPPGSDS
jgi:membrane protein